MNHPKIEISSQTRKLVMYRKYGLITKRDFLSYSHLVKLLIICMLRLQPSYNAMCQVLRRASSLCCCCHSAGNYLLGWQQTQQRESSMEMNVITYYMHGLNYHQTPELLLALQLIKTAFKIPSFFFEWSKLI